MGLVPPPQRPPRHRTSRCLVLLRHRPPPATIRVGSARVSRTNPVVLRRAPDTTDIAQRAGARPQRLLSVLRAHGPAPGADPDVPAVAPGRHTRLAAASPGEPP